MFYSQFILSKKGPLGTIWIAAHLERKLRKHQIAETDIRNSVDFILFPEVPIALRLSGHLLLGVVRIYSRKVEYLYHDCNEALHKIKQAFNPTSSIDLPPEAVKGSFRSVTLPEALDFDDLEGYLERENASTAAQGAAIDNHIVGRDLITLEDRADERGCFGSLVTLEERYSIGHDPYAALSLDNQEIVADGKKEITRKKMDVSTALEEDVLPPLRMDDEMEIIATPPHDVDMRFGERSKSPSVHLGNQDILERRIEFLETMRVETAAEPDRTHEKEILDADLETPKEPNLDKELPSRVEDAPQSLQENPQVEQRDGKITSSIAAPHEDDLLAKILGRTTPNLEVVATPMVSPSELQPKQGRGKKNSVIDDGVIIPSQLMKRQLTNTDDIRRVRRKAPCAEIDISKLERASYSEQVFTGSSFPGLCAELRGLYDRIFRTQIKLPALESSEGTSIPHVVPTVQVDRLEGNQEEVVSSRKVLKIDNAEQQEIVEHVDIPLRMEESELVRQVESRVTSMEEDLAHDLAIGNTIAVAEVEKDRVAGGSDVDIAGKVLNAEALTDLSVGTASVGLGFLADSKETDTGTDGAMDIIHDFDKNKNIGPKSTNWSSRTRSLAQYLRTLFEKSEAAARLQGDKSFRASLDNLLKGRSRKEASRMFFEILVLKTKGYIDVHQDVGAGDISLISTSLLMDEIF